MNNSLEIIRRWYREVWTLGHLDQIDILYRPAPPEECLRAERSVARHELRELITILRELVTKTQVTVVQVLQDGDWCAAYVELTGFKAGTHQPVQMNWIAMMRLEGEYIVESYPFTNFISLFEQLGQLPRDTFELLLSGTKLK